MANYCIFRSEKLKTHQDVKLVLKEQHRAADYESKRADSSQSYRNSYSSDFDTAMKKYDDLLPAKIRKNAVVGLNFMVTTSEEFKTAEEERAFYEKARQFIGERFGDVVGWAIHRDETSTHMQVVTIPLVKGKLNARELIGGDKHKMHSLQNDFYEQVGKPFGLERGKENPERQHKTVEEYHRERNQDLDRREAELAEREKQAQIILGQKTEWENSKTQADEFAASLDEDIKPLPKLEKVSNIGTAERLEKNFPAKKTGTFSHENPYEYADRQIKGVWDWFSKNFYNPLVEKCNKLLKAVKDLKRENVLQKTRIRTLEAQNNALNTQIDEEADRRANERYKGLSDADRAKILEPYKWADKFMLGESVRFEWTDGFSFTCRTGKNSLRKIGCLLDDYETLQPYDLEQLAKKMKSHGFKTVRDARDYADKKGISDITKIPQKQRYQGCSMSD